MNTTQFRGYVGKDGLMLWRWTTPDGTTIVVLDRLPSAKHREVWAILEDAEAAWHGPTHAGDDATLDLGPGDWIAACRRGLVNADSVEIIAGGPRAMVWLTLLLGDNRDKYSEIVRLKNEAAKTN